MSLLSLFGDNSSEYGDLANLYKNLAANYDPYVSAGSSTLHDLMGRYSKMISDPTFLENKVASSYMPSDYAQSQSKYITDQLNNNAAATGDLGGSYSANNLATALHRLISGDENNYINNANQMYGAGLSGEQEINSMGYNALGQQNNLLSQSGQAQAQGEMSSQNALNEMIGQGLSFGGDFLTGGTGGLSDVFGAFGKKAMPNFTNQFGGQQNILTALKTLKDAGYM